MQNSTSSKKQRHFYLVFFSAKSQNNCLQILSGTQTHRKNILSKSGCKNAADLVARGISEGWI